MIINQFPIPQVLSEEQIKFLLEELSYRKAITLNGITDSIFKKENATRVSGIFKGLRTIDLSQIERTEASFTSRLVPLNKAFASLVIRKQMHHFSVYSSLQKRVTASFVLAVPWSRASSQTLSPRHPRQITSLHILSLFVLVCPRINLSSFVFKFCWDTRGQNYTRTREDKSTLGHTRTTGYKNRRI